MTGVATLYVRNVPTELYGEVQRWAAESGRSVNAEVLHLLEREVAERRRRSEWGRALAALKAQIRPVTGPPWPEDLIREDRAHGHRG